MDSTGYEKRDTKRQANFLLPERLVKELRRLVPPKKRSQVVARALERELERIKLIKAIGEYFGAWQAPEQSQ